AVALLAQAKALQPGWLFPLLGAGPAAVLSCAERAAGPMALAALDVAFLGDGDRAARARALRTLGRAALLCAGAALAFGMAVPVMPGEASNRLVRIAMLAGCGQSGFAAETIYVLLMAGGMLMVGFQILAASAALRVALPRASFRACALVCGAAAALLCAGSLSGEEAALAAGPYVYPAALLAAGLAALPARRREAAA
ncbi:MAG: hypothetical protein IKO07_05305, partial [Clostridia bacterium]|nr:hypothetical protein [Clostridia bacterium]